MTNLNWDAAIARANALTAGWGDQAPGGAIVLFDATRERAAIAAGLADLATQRPFAPDTVSRLASITKHIFCAFVLARSDVVGLDDPLGRHLPELPPGIGAVTVGRALDMSGGVPDTREALTLLGHSIFTRTEAADLLRLHCALTRPNYPPGTEVHYSNGGYRLVEEALRRHGWLFSDYVRKVLCPALKVEFSAWEHWTEPVPGLAPGYWHDGQGWQVGLQGMHLSAAGALTGSARDLAIWGRALLSETAPLSGTLAALCAPRTLTDGQSTGYGLGMRHQKCGPHALVGHGGGQPGYKSFLLLSPDTGSGVAIVANRDDINTAQIAAEAMAALLETPLPEATSTLVPGLYVASAGADWLEVKAGSAIRLDDEVALFDGGDGWSDSYSATSRLRLRMADGGVEGQAGHAPVRYGPVSGEVPTHLDGEWEAPALGACLTIRDGAVIFGSDPARQAMPLRPLGNGRYLFTRTDGPWTRRICLCETGAGQFDLALSRARKIGWVRRGISGD